MDNLVVVVPSFGFVGEKTAKLSEESLPVAGNVLHPQVVEDECLTPVEREGKRITLTAQIQQCVTSTFTVSNT